MPRFRNLAANEISQKRHPRDLVTIADIEAERCLSALLGNLCPGSAVVGEEGAEANAGILKALSDQAPVWLLDPVDGTTNYATGKPCFAVIVAYCAQGETIAGWIHDPIADVTLWAAAGEGAWLDDGSSCRLVHVAASRRIGDMAGSLSPRAASQLQGKLAGSGGGSPRVVRYGCVGREYIDLGQGVLSFAQYTRLKPWDHAAGVLIHHEAGGFSALRPSRSPYQAMPYIVEETLLLAPDEAAWRNLDELLN